MKKTTVWKFELEITDEQQVKLPLFARILKVAPAFADGKLDLWVQVQLYEADLEDWMEKPDRYETRTFHIFGTGHPIPDAPKLQHVDTLVTAGGSLVWHVFEVV